MKLTGYFYKIYSYLQCGIRAWWTCNRANLDSLTKINNIDHYDQGRTEIRCSPGQEASLVPPMFEPDVFRKQIYRIEESTCDSVGTFRRSDSAPGALCPARPRLSKRRWFI